MAAALVLAGSLPAQAETSPDEHRARRELASTLATMTLSILKDQQSRPADREANLKRSFADVVDIDWIARFVLGNSWRVASDEQRGQYVALYRKYLTNAYVANYAENRERQIRDIKVLAVHDSEANDDNFTTRTEIVLTTAERLKVDYLAAKQEDGGYKIIDVAIEGVSLLTSHRAEFGRLATAEGVDAVIGKLRQLVQAERPAIALSMK